MLRLVANGARSILRAAELGERRTLLPGLMARMWNPASMPGQARLSPDLAAAEDALLSTSPHI